MFLKKAACLEAKAAPSADVLFVVSPLEVFPKRTG